MVCRIKNFLLPFSVIMPMSEMREQIIEMVAARPKELAMLALIFVVLSTAGLQISSTTIARSAAKHFDSHKPLNFSMEYFDGEESTISVDLNNDPQLEKILKDLILHICKYANSCTCTKNDRV